MAASVTWHPPTSFLEMKSIYEGKGALPVCYPGTKLSGDLASLAGYIAVIQPNLIGTHTHSDIGEGGFADFQSMETKVIYWLGKYIGSEYPENELDGYFCTGGTEGNLMGNWVGREYLKKKHAEVVLICPESVHYSIIKAANILSLPMITIKLNDKGEVDLDDLTRIIGENKTKGLLFNFTIGTSLMGAVDPVWKIEDILGGLPSDNYYVHLDMAFGGFTLPFIKDPPPFCFHNKCVSSCIIDGHKMGGMPYPSGIFICRKGLQSNVTRDVKYIRGSHDDTVCGSRSGIGPACGYYLMEKQSWQGYHDDLMKCLSTRDEMAEKLIKIKGVKVFNCSPYVNLLPIGFDFPVAEDDIEKDVLIKDYHLRRDNVKLNGKEHEVFKLCIMPHVIPIKDMFIEDLVKFVNKKMC